MWRQPSNSRAAAAAAQEWPALPPAGRRQPPAAIAAGDEKRASAVAGMWSAETLATTLVAQGFGSQAGSVRSRQAARPRTAPAPRSEASLYLGRQDWSMPENKVQGETREPGRGPFWSTMWLNMLMLCLFSVDECRARVRRYPVSKC